MSNLKMERGRERRVISHYQKKKTKFIVDSSLPEHQVHCTSKQKVLYSLL